MKYIYLAPLYAKATEAGRHSIQLSSTRNRTQAYRTQVRLASPRHNRALQQIKFNILGFDFCSGRLRACVNNASETISYSGAI